MIDFDDCAFSYLIYDCGTTVSFIEHKAEVPALIAAWVHGYRKVADLPEEDEAEIPTFVMLRRLLLVAWIGSHSETGLARYDGRRLHPRYGGPLQALPLALPVRHGPSQHLPRKHPGNGVVGRR